MTVEEQTSLLDPPCVFCGRPAEFLCDAILGWEPEEHWIRKFMPERKQLGIRPYTVERRRVTKRCFDEEGRWVPPHTCDLEVCSDCRRTGPPIHFKMQSRCEWVVEDYCPAHEAYPVGVEITTITAAEAEEWRRAVRQRGES